MHQNGMKKGGVAALALEQTVEFFYFGHGFSFPAKIVKFAKKEKEKMD